MADEPKGPSSGFLGVDRMSTSQKKGTSATKGYTTAIEQQGRAQSATNQQLIAGAETVGNLERGNRDAAKAADSLTGVLKEQYLALREAYKEYTSLSGMMRSAGQQAGTYGKSLLKLTSLTSHYHRQLEMITEAQDLNKKSMMNYTAATGQASKNMQQYLTSVTKSHLRAADVAGKFKTSTEEVEKVQKNVRANFATQMAAYKDLDGTSKHLVESTLALASAFGVDAAEATSFMQERMQLTNKTLKEVEKESFLVAKAIDKYTESLHKNGKEALRSAKITKQQLVKAIREANQEFRQGNFDAASYAAMLTPLAEKFQREMGASTEETNDFVKSVGKMMSGLQDADLGNLFGIQGAQSLLTDLEGNMDKLDKGTQKRVKAALELTKGESQIQQLSAVMEAGRGSAYMMETVMRKMQAVGDSEVRGRLMQQAGLKGARARSFMAREFGESGKGFKGFREAEKDRKGKSKAQTEAEKWRDKMIKLATETVTPTEAAAKATLEIRDKVQKIEQYLKYSLTAALALIVARLALGAFRGIRGMRANSLAGKGWHGMSKPPTAGMPPPASAPISSARPPMAPGLAAPASAAPAAAAGAGRFARAGQAIRRGAGGLGRAGSFMNRGGGKALGVAGVALGVGLSLRAAAKHKGGTSDKMQVLGTGLADTGTMGMYSMIAKPAEKALYARMSEKKKRTMGGDATFSRMLAESEYGGPNQLLRGLGMVTGGKFGKGRTGAQQKALNEIDRVRVKRRGALSDLEMKQYKTYQKLLHKAKHAKDLMSEEDKKQLKAAIDYTNKYKRWVKLREEGFKASREQTKEETYTDTGLAISKMQKGEFSHIKDKKKRTAAIMEKLLDKSGRLVNMPGGQEAMKRMFSGKGGKTAMSQLAAAKFKQQFTELGGDAEYGPELARQMIERRQIQKKMNRGGGTKKEMAIWNQVIADRKKKGMKEDMFAVTREFMQRTGKKTGALDAGTNVQISTDIPLSSGGGAGLAQDGDYDQSSGVMTYNIVTPLKINVRPLAGAVGTETGKENLTNNSSPGV